MTCPDCQRHMEVTSRGEDAVLVKLDGTTPPAPCCQNTATEKHTKLGMFVTGG